MPKKKPDAERPLRLVAPDPVPESLGAWKQAGRPNEGKGSKPSRVKTAVAALDDEYDLSPDGRDPRLCTDWAVLRYEKGDPTIPPEMWLLPILDDNGRRQYRPCGAYSIKGRDVCTNHGGSIPVLKMTAEELLAATRDRLMFGLLQVALDETVDVPHRLKAMMWGLERAGFQAGVTVSVGLAPWQQVLTDIKQQFEAEGEKVV